MWRFVPVLLLFPAQHEAHNRTWQRALNSSLSDIHMAVSSLVHYLSSEVGFLSDNHSCTLESRVPSFGVNITGEGG